MFFHKLTKKTVFVCNSDVCVYLHIEQRSEIWSQVVTQDAPHSELKEWELSPFVHITQDGWQWQVWASYSNNCGKLQEGDITESIKMQFCEKLMQSGRSVQAINRNPLWL